MNEERTIKFKSKRFAVRIVKLYNYLCNEKKEYVLSKQILRSGTSIGANIAESECAISRKDFIAKVYIALKECVETIYWLDLLYETNYIDNAMYNSMKNDCEEMRKMMSSTTKTMNSPNTQTTELNTPNSKPQTSNSKLMYNSMENDCEEMRKMMSSTTKTMNSPNTQTTELNTPNSKPQTLNSKLNPQNSTLMKRGEVE